MSRTPRLLALATVALLALLALLPAGAAAREHAEPGSVARAAPARLTLVLPLAADTAGLARFATAVSTPGSTLYHHYRSIAWLAAHFGARPAAEARVVTYLHAHGARGVRIDRTGLFVDASLPTATAQALFGPVRSARADRASAASAHSTTTTAAATTSSAPAASARVPAALAGAVTGVVGLDTRPVVAEPALARAPAAHAAGPFSSIAAPLGAAQTSSAQTGSAQTEPAQTPTAGTSGYMTATGTTAGCQAATSVGGFTPNQYLTAYNYTALQSAGTLGQGERVALIEVDGFHKSDIDAFAKCFGLAVPKIVAFRANSSVAKDGLPAGGESTLDLEVLDAAAPDLSQIDVYESSEDIASVLESLTAPLQNTGYKPEVISASLGLCESQVRQAVGLAAIRNTEAALEEAAASGISMLAASGDDGSADCVDSNSPQALPEPKLAVNYPASSPWVTSVGGTNLILTSTNTIQSQVVWNDGANDPGAAGGGGYSKLFVRPSYQDGLVRANQRVVPDVTGLADVAPGYVVYCSAAPECVSIGATDPWQSVGGTSASTPLVAGGLALIDEQLRQHQKQSLGLVNPLLYELGRNATEAPLVFSDVTTGSNDVGPYIRASRAPLGCCSAGPGFDAASGWGSVELGGLATAALAAQPALVDVAQTVSTHQRPVLARALYDRVSCTGACQLGAYAQLQIGHATPVTLHSGLYHLTRAGTKLVKIALPPAELTKLRAALLKHQRITATVFGAILDAPGNIERRTPATSFTITQ